MRFTSRLFDLRPVDCVVILVVFGVLQFVEPYSHGCICLRKDQSGLVFSAMFLLEVG